MSYEDTTQKNALQRLWADLNRPAGGWTMGFLTILGAAVAPIGGQIVGLPEWASAALAVVLLGAHLMWSAYGYYPRRL